MFELFKLELYLKIFFFYIHITYHIFLVYIIKMKFWASPIIVFQVNNRQLTNILIVIYYIDIYLFLSLAK